MDPELRNYLLTQSASEEKIIKYFKSDPDYYFEEESLDYNLIKGVIELANIFIDEKMGENSDNIRNVNF